ncbi:MAG: M23 family metallopeptidase [Sphingobacteriaceae bacterium]|nr:M23 family metallopeptidase [Sphingobacteriaceae bacterium]
MRKRKEKTTVIFVSKHQNITKPIQIPSTYIKNWRVYLFSFLTLVVFMVASIFYLSYSNSSLENKHAKALKALFRSKKELSRFDTTAVNTQYKAINEKINTINKLLKSKGVKTTTVKPNTGGEAGFEVLNTEESAEFYNKYLNKFIYNLSHTPIGKPNMGRISSRFGYRENPFTGQSVETHKGLDIKAKHGSLVKSTAVGRVAYTGYRGGFGNLIIINHGNGFETYFGHLSKILVKQGQSIKIGQNIGRVGSTGRSTGPHLHYEIHKNGKIVNPKSFLTLK